MYGDGDNCSMFGYSDQILSCIVYYINTIVMIVLMFLFIRCTTNVLDTGNRTLVLTKCLYNYLLLIEF